MSKRGALALNIFVLIRMTKAPEESVAFIISVRIAIRIAKLSCASTQCWVNAKSPNSL